MWIIIKKTYAGRLGSFYRNQKYDLPQDVVGQLPKKYFKETCAPWDEQVDQDAAKRNAFLEKVHNAIKKAETLAAECKDVAVAIEKLQDTLEQKVREEKNAADKAKKLAKSAGIKWPPKANGENTGNAGQ